MRFTGIPGSIQQQGEFKIGQAIQEMAKDLTQTEALQAPEERNQIFSSLGERVAGIHFLPTPLSFRPLPRFCPQPSGMARRKQNSDV